MLFPAGAFTPAAAQSPLEGWSAPVNLSRSGAAAQPRIAAGSGGALQAFWLDRFDGVTTARFGAGRWGAPSAAPIQTLPASAMPTLVEDARGWAHAFWLGTADRTTGAQPLLHSQMQVGGAAWSAPQTLAGSAAAFDVAAGPGGAITVAYVRTLHDAASPAGVYVRRSAGGGTAWGAAVGVYKTIYFRLLTSANAHVRIADAGSGILHLVWDDPRLGEALYARSTDSGAAWSAPEPLGEPAQRPARPRVFALPDGGALRMWEAAGMGACVLYQQQFTTAWGAPQRVFEGLSPCPQAERAWTYESGVVWLWGQGTGALTFAVWDAATGQWSQPLNLGFRFQDAESSRWVGLGDLHATLADGALAVAGADATTGEVWATVAQVSALQVAFAPPSPWTGPERLSQQGQAANYPSAAMDAQGNIHVVWCESSQGGGPGTSLSYARWDAASKRWSRTVVLQQGISGVEMTRWPALIAGAQGLLHLVWSSGEQGQIAYSRARTGEAASSGGWSTPRGLSAAGSSGSWPQIGEDAAGRLYVLYAVPLNEGRGIYLASSSDSGATWSPPKQVFDAAADGWAMVDHPALLVTPDGVLHAAWVRAALPGTWQPQGIVYARSDNGGVTWTAPETTAGAGYDWPRLALAGGKTHLLYAATVGGLWHRSLANGAGNGDVWSVAVRVRGWDAVRGPFGLAVSGPPFGEHSTLHAAGAGSNALLYSAWDGSAWSAAESYALGPDALTGLGAAAASLPAGGRFAVALLAASDGQGSELPAVFGMARAIAAVDEELLPTPVPTRTPAITPTFTPSPTLVPSPTPNLNTPVTSGFPVDARILGGGLAMLVVLAALALLGIRRVRRA